MTQDLLKRIYNGLDARPCRAALWDDIENKYRQNLKESLAAQRSKKSLWQRFWDWIRGPEGLEGP